MQDEQSVNLCWAWQYILDLGNNSWQNNLNSRSTYLLVLEFSTVSHGLGMHWHLFILSYMLSLTSKTILSPALAHSSSYEGDYQADLCLFSITIVVCRRKVLIGGLQNCVPSELPNIQFETSPPPPSNPSKIWINLYFCLSHHFPSCPSATVRLSFSPSERETTRFGQ